MSAVNSVEDFCLFAPPEPGADSTIGETEVCFSIHRSHLERVLLIHNPFTQRFEVSWCMKVPPLISALKIEQRV